MTGTENADFLPRAQAPDSPGQEPNGTEADLPQHKLGDAESFSETASKPQSAVPVLGPVAAKGPKRFGAMPDLSKIPPQARERMAKYAAQGQEWGISSVDARNLTTRENPEEVALDLSPLGAPTPVVSRNDELENRDGLGNSALTPDPLAQASSNEPPVNEALIAEESEDYPEFADDIHDEGDSPIFGADATSLLTDLPGPAFRAASESFVNLGPMTGIDDDQSASSTDPGQVEPDPVPDPLTVTNHPIAVTHTHSTPTWNDGVPLPEEPDDLYDPFPYEPHYAQERHSPNLAPTEAPTPSQPGDSSTSSTQEEQPPTALRGTVSPQDVRERAEAHLRQLVGRPDAKLREDQWTAIEALVLNRSRALVVQRTGWGKSAVYFVATSLLRAQGDGPAIIISPLLALMRDQISAAQRAGIKAATINSANVTEWDHIQDSINRGEVDVLLCSPERLNNPAFRDEVLPRLARDAGLVVIDEAHCISDWGHDFRPDYRRIRTLLQELRPGIPVLATTATANSRVSADIAEQLSVSADGNLSNVTVLRGSLDRESLHLAVVQLADSTQRVAWIIDALKHLKGSGIVYCMTVSAALEVTAQLRAAGHDVAAYTGQTDPEERAQLEQRLKANQVKALIATSALGMGFDKPDLSFVIHLGAPNSPIAYYQQVGRAGRGVAHATSVLLPGKEDREIWEYFGSLAFPEEATVREVLNLLDAAAANGMGPISIPQLESKVDLKRSRLEMMLKVLDVDGAVRRVQKGWISTGQPWRYDRERYRRVEAARVAEQNSMLQYASTKQCRIAFLRASLDDPDLSPSFACGRCDNCGGVNLPHSVSQEAQRISSDAVARPGIDVPARKMWPTNMIALGVDVSGRIKAEHMAQDGRAIARIDGLGWSNELRAIFSPNATDSPVPVHLRTAAVQVLDNWPEVKTIEGVVAVRSLSRPGMVDHLARGLASYLKIPFIGTAGPIGDSPATRHDVNSAMRLAGVSKRLGLELNAGALAGLPGRSVLLVDDYTDSGWTLTIAAKLLREAGAQQVFPFVLAQF